MKKIVCTISRKGGVGKTATARVIGETLRRRLPGALLVDGNGSVGQFLQYLGLRDGRGKMVDPQPEPEGVRAFDMHGDERDRDSLLRLLESGFETIFADLPAESLPMLGRLARELAFFDLVESSGYQLTLISPVTPYRASVRDVQDALALAPRAQHVIVRNLGFGDAANPARNDPGDFKLWDSSRTRQAALDAGAIIVDLPRCKSGVLAALDDRSLSFESGLKSGVLDIADRQRLFVWLRAAQAAFAPVFALLGVSMEEQT